MAIPSFLKQPRKIVQIALAAIVDSDGVHRDVLYALCDDGSVWRLYRSGGEQRWGRQLDIPQPEA